MLPAQPNQSLIDGLACLQALSEQEAPIGSRDLARQLGLDATRTNRLLKTLAYLGLAEQDGKRKYRPGPAIHVLAAQSMLGSGLMQRAFGPLESLTDLGYIVAMGVLWRGHVCYLYHNRGTPPDAHGLGHPRLLPATSSGLGMAMLAYRDDGEDPSAALQELRQAAAGSPTADGGTVPEWAKDPAALQARLEAIRYAGYAVIPISEGPPSTRTVGVPLGRPPYAAIGISGQIPEGDIPAIVLRLQKAAREIDRPRTPSEKEEGVTPPRDPDRSTRPAARRT